MFTIESYASIAEEIMDKLKFEHKGNLVHATQEYDGRFVYQNLIMLFSFGPNAVEHCEA